MVALLNLMALDVGERRIGLAVANSTNLLSTPLKTLTFSGSVNEEISELIKANEIDVLVVGLPKNLNDEDTDQTRFVRSFTDKLQKTVKIPINYENEALSSARAKKTLEQSKKPYQKSDIDSLAACFILDDYMANNKEVLGV
jgi:putative Holliday junction resolvase